MTTMMFANLPVTDLPRSKKFYLDLGFTVNPEFTDDTAACIVLDDDHLYLMLLTHESYARFTSKSIVDSTMASEVILSISAEDRTAVDTMANTALAVGGSVSSEPQDLDFMYSRSFQDPDGHLWEVMYLDMSATTADVHESSSGEAVSGPR